MLKSQCSIGILASKMVIAVAFYQSAETIQHAYDSSSDKNVVMHPKGGALNLKIGWLDCQAVATEACLQSIKNRFVPNPCPKTENLMLVSCSVQGFRIREPH
jgi:hypothetical protein